MGIALVRRITTKVRKQNQPFYLFYNVLKIQIIILKFSEEIAITDSLDSKFMVLQYHIVLPVIVYIGNPRV